MSDLTVITKPLSGAAILAKVKAVDGVGSGLDSDIVITPVPRISSFGSYPQISSGIAAVPADPSATLARYLQGY